MNPNSLYTIFFIVMIIMIAFASYQIGKETGKQLGIDEYDKKLDKMEKDGDVIFPNKES